MFGRRVPATRDEPQAEHELGHPDRDLLSVMFMFWVISLIRVVIGLTQHETFGAEGSLAFLAVVLVPWLMKGVGIRRSSGNRTAPSKAPFLRRLRATEHRRRAS